MNRRKMMEKRNEKNDVHTMYMMHIKCIIVVCLDFIILSFSTCMCVCHTQHRKGTFLPFSFFSKNIFSFFSFLYFTRIKFFCTPSSGTTSSTTVDSLSDLSSVGTQPSQKNVATTSATISKKF